MTYPLEIHISKEKDDTSTAFGTLNAHGPHRGESLVFIADDIQLLFHTGDVSICWVSF